jgi:predicted nuclease of restriction endonuclease-like (RecB) superfamily
MADKSISNYAEILSSLKEKIRQAKTRAALSVNSELLKTYHEIGNTILEQQKNEGWGSKVIDRLAKDLKIEFPDMQGLSIRNFKYMRAFAEAYPHFPFMQAPPAQLERENEHPILSPIVQAPLAQLSWYHHITLLDKIKDPPIRLFYISKTIDNGWSRNVMVHQIEGGLHARQGALITNFTKTIASHDSELIQQIFKDPYYFDFLQLSQEAKERDLENALIEHITKVLLELGDGFAFMGRQYRLEAGEQEYFLDLLFYHTKLRRHVVIELKIGDFIPEFAGKMNFYLGLVDDKLKKEFDEPAIGLILCKTKNKIVAEYALRDTSKPIGIAEYKIAESLPEDIKGELPSIAELEQKLDKELKENLSPIETRLKAIKEKLKEIKTDEIQTPATYPILLNLYTDGLEPLYQEIIERLSIFEEEFYSKSFGWRADHFNTNKFDQLDALWYRKF